MIERVQGVKEDCVHWFYCVCCVHLIIIFKAVKTYN